MPKLLKRLDNQHTYILPILLVTVPRVAELRTADVRDLLKEVTNDPLCKFGAQYKAAEVSTLVEDCLKTAIASIKSNKDAVKLAKAYYAHNSAAINSLIEFANLKRTDVSLKRLMLYTAETIRLLSESKDILKGLEDKNRSISHLFDSIIYFNGLLKIQPDKTTLNTLKSNVKTFRNFIFSKIPIKRKNFIEDFLALTRDTRNDETMIIDNLRVLAKISELEKLAGRITNEPIALELINGLLTSKSDYVLSGCLQVIGNCLAVNPEFGVQLYNPENLASLLKIFERFCNKVI